MRCEGTLEDFKEYFGGLIGCCLQANAQDLIDRSVKLLGFVEGENDGPCGAAVTKLDDGQYAVFQEWSDYTGHG